MVSVGKAYPCNPTYMVKQQAASEVLTNHAEQQQAVEQRESRASTPKATNGKIRAMRKMFENGSSCKEEIPKQSVSCGNNLAERKRQLGFLNGAVNLHGQTIQQKDMNNVSSSPNRNVLKPAMGVTTKNRILKSRFADKKKMFERVFERNEFPVEANTMAVPLGGERTEAQVAVAQVLSDSDISTLVYDGSLLSDDAATARDEVEVTRPCQAKDVREMDGSHHSGEQHQTTDIESSLSPENSFQEALKLLVTSFEKDVKDIESAVGPPVKQSAGNVINDTPMCSGFDVEAPLLKENAAVPKSPANDDAIQNIEGVASCSSIRSTAVPLKSKSSRDLSPSQLLPDASLFSTVDQEKQKKKTKSEQTKVINAEVHKQQRAREVKAATAPTRMKTANRKGATPAESVAASTRSARYELVQPKKQSMKSLLRQKHQEPLSPVSTASWYSSESSAASTEVSQQLSPLQDPKLGMTAMNYSNRVSIGACVNAHLAENPPSTASETNSQNNSAQGKECKSANRRERRGSASSSLVSMKKRATSMCSVDAQYDGSVQHDAQDLQELAEAMTSMANTASNVVLDVIVEAADKVVVSPLISIFHCVDASEHLLCNGSHRVTARNKLDGKIKRSRRNKAPSSRSRSRSASRSASRSRKCKTQTHRKTR